MSTALDRIDRKLAAIQCGSGTGETCDCLICDTRWMRGQLAASEVEVATLRQALHDIGRKAAWARIEAHVSTRDEQWDVIARLLDGIEELAAVPAPAGTEAE